MIHPEANFLSSCEPVKPNKCLLPKDSAGTGLGETIPFENGEIGKKEGVTGPKRVQKPARIPLDLKAEA